jgi:hypothetical protein
MCERSSIKGTSCELPLQGTLTLLPIFFEISGSADEQPWVSSGDLHRNALKEQAE